MPFFSMVIFMLKWAIAAIPAAIMLVVIVMSSTADVSGVIASFRQISTKAEQTIYTPNIDSGTTVQTSKTLPKDGFAADTPIRCKGSTELEKCIEFERQLKGETPEQKAERQSRLGKQ
jgi:hypothetical protein